MTETEMKENDASMSPEERMAWLRDRGVVFETAEERKRERVAKILGDDHGGDLVYYVHIPADKSKPLEELSYRLPPKKMGGTNSLLDFLKIHLEPAFQDDTATVDIDMFREQHQTLLASGGGIGDALPVSDATLRSVAKKAHIATFSLVHPTPSNNYVGVIMYLDDIGMLKRLPLNTRASHYASRAGYNNPPPTFYGDVFLGRTRNTSLQLSELVGNDVGWLQRAAADNTSFQQHQQEQMGGGMTNQQQPSMPGSEGKEQEEKEGYTWTQTQEEIEIRLELPSSISKSKQLKVVTKPQSVQVMGDGKGLLSIALFENVDVDSCAWTLEAGKEDTKKLVITLEKVEEAFWPRIRD